MLILLTFPRTSKIIKEIIQKRKSLASGEDARATRREYSRHQSTRAGKSRTIREEETTEPSSSENLPYEHHSLVWIKTLKCRLLGEKRKRKLKELETLTSSRSPSNPSTDTTTNSASAVSSVGQGNTERANDEANTAFENPDWLFDFTTPAALDWLPASPFANPTPHTTTVRHKIDFPAQPSQSQRDVLARAVFATFSRARNANSLFSFDPYRNNLNVTTLSFAAGFFANTLHLGLVEHEYCHETAESNFYRPSIAASPYAETMVLAVQRSFDGLKPDLRPTSTQIKTSHHPALDLLPLPTLRTRLIEGLHHKPPFVNELEFWEDLREDGIVCWGNASAELCGGGVPWDARSWEAKQWFLDKYRGILGDEEDELWRASQWWREMRGEYL